MGGGLMQLVAYGAQDIYLTGNPQITFFKVVYRRHTNFSMEAIEQTWNGSDAANSRVTATISRNGDLVHRMYLEVSIGDGATGGNTDDNYGTQLINNVVCEIGGQQIDKHYGHWMETWFELTQNNPTAVSTTQHANGTDQSGTLFQDMTQAGGSIGASITYSNAAPLFIPFQFWFNRNPGLALPLIALQYHEVKIILEYSSVYNSTDSSKLWCDYIYLDTDERRRFAQVSHEYLIEQVQHSTYGSTPTSMDLNFNHPVKELIWTGTPTTGVLQLVSDSGTGDTKFQLKLNGHDRFAARDFRYFTRTQVWESHSGYGGVLVKDSIAVYSFALKPEEHQPSGTCNFSRIDNAQLAVTNTGASSYEVYAVNYNVLRIMSGMGGLAYSN
jgi:hypothetical protein